MSELSGYSTDNTSASEERLEIGRQIQHQQYRAYPPPLGRSMLVQPRSNSLRRSSNVDKPNSISYSVGPPGSGCHTSFLSAGDTSLRGGTLNLPHHLADNAILRTVWQQLADKRNDVVGIRSRLWEARAHTKRARRERDTADNAFMSFLRPLHMKDPLAKLRGQSGPVSLGNGPGTGWNDQFQALFQRLQETRDKCQDYELALEDLEDELDTAENQLDFLERQLVNHIHPVAPQQLLSVNPEPSISESLLGLEVEKAKHYPPDYNRFMSAIGYYKLANENHLDLLVRRDGADHNIRHLTLVEKHHSEAPEYIGPLLDEELQFLRNFDVEETKAIKEIERLQGEVDRLRDRCWERGIVPRYAPLHEIYDYYPDKLIIDSDEEDMSEYTTATQFPILLSNPHHLLGDFPITAKDALKNAASLPASHPEREKIFGAAATQFFIEHLMWETQAENKADFINRWILHKLRISTLEAELLYSIFVTETQLAIPDPDQWQRDVLYFWTRDEAATQDPEKYIGPITSVTFTLEGPEEDYSEDHSEESSGSEPMSI